LRGNFKEYVSYWHFSDMHSGSDHVRSRGPSGPPDFAGRTSENDPGCVKTQKSKRDEE
jgi:hypothetical protein